MNHRDMPSYKKSPRADVARGLLLCDKYLDYRLIFYFL